MRPHHPGLLPRVIPQLFPRTQTRLSHTAQRQHRLPAAYYRGGTSRAVFFNRADLPSDRAAWAPIFRGVLGSPDPNGRQLDGLGGGISSLSKVCVVSAPAADPATADLDFTFVALGIRDSSVDYSSNCGNMTAAVGPYAVDAGLLPVAPDAADCTVRIRNTNSNKLINASFPLVAGEAAAHGDFAIDGVAGTAARVKLDFVRPGGSRTGRLLPTGHRQEIFQTKEGMSVRGTCIDAGNPCILVRGADLGARAGIQPEEVEARPELLEALEGIRREAAVRMGLARDVEDPEMPGSVPKICMLAAPTDVTLPSGQVQHAKEVDVLARALSVGQPHRALPITVALALAAACEIEGSVAHECLTSEHRADEGGITIGHASGKIVVGAEYGADGELEAATVFRTARRLMEGTVFWK